MEELVSIIIPVYNCEKYIKKALESVLNQLYNNIEIIIVDDGSTDNSKEICEEYAIKDDRIKIYSQSNLGVSAARNLGISKANGKYICFVDADDYIESDAVLDYIESYKKYPDIQLVISGFFSEVEPIKNKKPVYQKMNMTDRYYKERNEIRENFISLWDNQLMYNLWNKMYLKSIIDENGIKFSKYNWGEDVKFNQEYLLNVNTMLNLEKCHYHYIRERKGAATNKYIKNFYNIRLKEFNEFNEFFERYGIEKEKYFEFSCRRYIERTLGCVENLFVKECKLSFKEKYNEVKKILNNEATRISLKVTKPKSKKIKILLITYKYRLVLLTMMMGKILNFVKKHFPALFNKLKNER